MKWSSSEYRKPKYEIPADSCFRASCPFLVLNPTFRATMNIKQEELVLNPNAEKQVQFYKLSSLPKI